MNRRRFALALIVVTGFVLLVPFHRLVCPDWDVWVFDESANAMEGMSVRLIYQDYTVESISHEETHTTDANGHARFNAKKKVSTVAAYSMGSVRSFLRSGVHASFGRYA